MAGKTLDATMKSLVEIEPESWPALLGQPTEPTTVIDADIATVSGAADKVLRVDADPPYLLHLEFVTGHDVVTLPRKLCVRNGLLHDRHDLRVRSGVILLHPEADSPQLTGLYEQGFPGEAAYLTFRYQVVRVWRLPPEPLLKGGLALLPLAPISAVTEPELPGIIQQMGQRLSARPAREQAPKLWSAAYILAGLRYPSAVTKQLFRGVESMKESSTYQAIVEEGRIEGRTQGAVAEAKRLLLLLGSDAFGAPDNRTAARIERINDVTELEELLKRVRTATSWQELLGQQTPSRKSRQRPTP